MLILYETNTVIYSLLSPGVPEDKTRAKEVASPPEAEKGEAERLVEEGVMDEKKGGETNSSPHNMAKAPKKKSVAELLFGRFITLYKGWGVYFRQKVLPAGIAFACEFLTILAFDNITSGQ